MIEFRDASPSYSSRHGGARSSAIRDTAVWLSSDTTRPTQARSDFERRGCMSTVGAAATRGMLWIDGVGGYLVCRGAQNVFGPPGHTADVPIWADLSRQHAMLIRDSEGYQIVSQRSVSIDQQPVHGRAVIRHGQLLQLGGSVQLRFRRPHPWGLTARLDCESAHRTQPAADGILLAAGVCVLGPSGQSHIVCPNWRRELLLLPAAQGWQVRYPGSFRMSGVDSTDQGVWSEPGRLELPGGVVTWELLNS